MNDMIQARPGVADRGGETMLAPQGVQRMLALRARGAGDGRHHDAAAQAPLDRRRSCSGHGTSRPCSRTDVAPTTPRTISMRAIARLSRNPARSVAGETRWQHPAVPSFCREVVARDIGQPRVARTRRDMITSHLSGATA